VSDLAFNWALIDHFVDSKPSKSRSQTIGAGATISSGVAFRARPSFVWTVASAVPLRRLAPTTFSRFNFVNHGRENLEITKLNRDDRQPPIPDLFKKQNFLITFIIVKTSAPQCHANFAFGR
jgi:hypothetical protein